MLKPSVVPVVLNDDSACIGLFTTAQARHRGKRADVSNARPVGGLIVEMDAAPEAGLLLIEKNILGKMPCFPAFSSSIRQIIRTDGATWLAQILDDKSGQWTTTEEYQSAAVTADSFMDTGLVEFLRRAMLCRDDKDLLAKTVASFCRELIEYIQLPTARTLFRTLCKQYQIQSAAEPKSAIAAAFCLTLDAVLDGLTNASSAPKQNKKIAALRTRITKICGMHPDAARSDAFLDVLWREVYGGKTDLLGISNNDKDSTLLRSLVEAAKPKYIVDIGAASGNRQYQIAGLGSDTFFLSLEPDPILRHVARFRMRRADTSKTYFHYLPAIDSKTLSTSLADMSGRGMVFADCVPQSAFGLSPTVEKADERFAALERILSEHTDSIACARVPALMLDRKEYVALRKKLADSKRRIWVQYDTTQTPPKDKRTALKATAVLVADSVSPSLEGLPATFTQVQPDASMQYTFMPAALEQSYMSWPGLTDIAAVPPFNGPVERRGMTLIDTDGKALAKRVRDYLSPDVPDAELPPEMLKNVGRFTGKLTRQKLQARLTFVDSMITPYPFRPFDQRFACLREMRPVFSDPATELHVIASIPDNWMLVATEGDKRIGDSIAGWASPIPCDYDFFAGRSRHFPVMIPESALEGKSVRTSHGGWGHGELRPVVNLSAKAQAAFQRLGHSKVHAKDAGKLWDFCLGVLYTPSYRTANKHAIAAGVPRIPVPGWDGTTPRPGVKKAFAKIADIGTVIRGILNGEPLPHADILAKIAVVHCGTDAVQPAQLTEEQRELRGNWGIASNDKTVREGKGSAHAATAGKELMKAFLDLAEAMSVPADECMVRLGTDCVDIQANEAVWWRGIPSAAWTYMIGGRRVLRKWLSYREYAVVNRTMTVAEMNTFADIARRLVVLELLGIQLDQLWAELVGADS